MSDRLCPGPTVYLLQRCAAPVSNRDIRADGLVHNDHLRADIGGAEGGACHEAAGGTQAVPRHGGAHGPAAGVLPRGRARPEGLRGMGIYEYHVGLEGVNG